MGQEYDRALPAEDRKIIKGSWRTIRQKMHYLGYSLLQTFMESYPSAREIYPSDVELLKELGLHHMRETSELISSIDNQKRLEFITGRLIREYHPFAKFPELYEGWRHSFIHVLRTEVFNDNSQKSKQILTSWEIALHTFIHAIMEKDLLSYNLETIAKPNKLIK